MLLRASGTVVKMPNPLGIYSIFAFSHNILHRVVCAGTRLHVFVTCIKTTPQPQPSKQRTCLKEKFTKPLSFKACEQSAAAAKVMVAFSTGQSCGCCEDGGCFTGTLELWSCREMKRIAALRGLHLSHTYMCKARPCQ